MNNSTIQRGSVGQTLSTVLGSVQSVAVATSRIFDGATEGIEMGHRAIQQASANQLDKHKMEQELFREELIAEGNFRKLKLEDTIVAYVGNDVSKQERYKQHDARMRALIYGDSAPANT